MVQAREMVRAGREALPARDFLAGGMGNVSSLAAVMDSKCEAGDFALGSFMSGWSPPPTPAPAASSTVPPTPLLACCCNALCAGSRPCPPAIPRLLRSWLQPTEARPSSSRPSCELLEASAIILGQYDPINRRPNQDRRLRASTRSARSGAASLPLQRFITVWRWLRRRCVGASTARQSVRVSSRWPSDHMPAQSEITLAHLSVVCLRGRGTPRRRARHQSRGTALQGAGRS